MRNLALVILLVALASAEQRKYRFCATEDVTVSACYDVERLNSEVTCLRVHDNAECAIRIAQGEADFGVFTAEDLLLAYPFYQNSLVPIKQLRHRNRIGDPFEFETVAVVHADFTQNSVPPGSSFDFYKNTGFCHPGFSTSQWWNDYILKHFEKTLTSTQCRNDMSIVENEARNLENFFGKACRPGNWASDEKIDKELKRKYKNLCALCDNPVACTYDNEANHGHSGALECLIDRRGNITYVARTYAHKHLGINSSYEFLCPNGARTPLSNADPCTWLQQPWPVVATRRDRADNIEKKLTEWLRPDLPKEPWMITLSKIILDDKVAINMTGSQSLTTYLSPGRDVDFLNSQTCDRTLRWCTVNDMEANKCDWVARAAFALGIQPRISCTKSNSVFECLRKISDNQTDIITIDSNYGYVARKVFDLSTVVYCEPRGEDRSKVIAVVHDQPDNNYPVRRFQDLKNKAACFPEYAGISWLSFISTARKTGIVSSKSCDYPFLVSKLLSGACTPGIKDRDHSRSTATADISSKLCSACVHTNNTSCAANRTNHYYGDEGAMRCLKDEAGAIAFVEVGNVQGVRRIDASHYRVLCKNGSLALNSGFDVDDVCALSVTIDSEVIGRKNDSPVRNTDIFLALMKIEGWLGYLANTVRPIDVYGPFNGTYNLLFKDSTSGLVPTSTSTPLVDAYKDLFGHVSQCSSGHLAVTANFIFVALVALYHLLF